MSNSIKSDYMRLEEQIDWYDQKSIKNQNRFKLFRFLEILSAACVPISTFFANHWITATLGIAIVVLQGIESMNQYNLNWIVYRSTCEQLKHEKHFYMENAGPYDSMTDEQAKKELVLRTESLISAEHAKWVSSSKTYRKMTTKN